MITGELKSKVDRIWDAMWSGGISNPLSVIEQLTYLLFIKRLDELHTLKERKGARTGRPIEEPVFTARQGPLRWSRFKELAPERMFETMRDRVFPFIKLLGQTGNSDDGSTYTHHMKDALFMMPTARVLANVVDQLDDIDMADRDTKDTDGNYLAVCRSRRKRAPPCTWNLISITVLRTLRKLPCCVPALEAAENGLRLDALGNLISITVLRAISTSTCSARSPRPGRTGSSARRATSSG